MVSNLGAMLASGGVEVLDCSGVLGPDTPILQLPPDFAKNTPKVEIHKISEYDDDGPFFAWNWMVLGEHSGTHFDAPHHWVTGKDYPDGYTDSLNVQRLVAPVNVIDCSAQAAEDEDYLLTAVASSAPCSVWKAEPAKSDRFIAPQSWRKPGRVYSPVFTAPPGSAACSKIATFQPWEPRMHAQASELWPAPMITASGVSFIADVHSPAQDNCKCI